MSRERSQLSIVPARVLDDPSIRPAAITVLVALSAYANKDGWCFPGVGTIAERLGISRAAVQKQLRALEVGGYIETRSRRRPNGSHTSNAYRVLYDGPGGQPEVALPDIEQPLAVAEQEQPHVAPPRNLTLPSLQPQVGEGGNQGWGTPATSEVAPVTPQENSPLNSPSEPTSAPARIDYVGFFVDRCRIDHGYDPDDRLKGQAARFAGKATDRGYPEPAIRHALQGCARNRHFGHWGNLLADAQSGKATNATSGRATRRSYTDEDYRRLG